LFFLAFFAAVFLPRGWTQQEEAQPKNVTLWTGEGTFTQNHQGSASGLVVSWERTVRFNFNVDQTRYSDLDTMEIFHTLNGVWKDPQGHEAFSLHHFGWPGADARSVLPNEFNYNKVQVMSVKTCDPDLSAPREDAPDNTFYFGLVATPQTLLTTPGTPIPPQAIKAPGLVIKVESPYDYRKAELTFPEKDVPQILQKALPQGLDAGMMAGVNPYTIPAKVKATLKRKPLELKYEVEKDLAGSFINGFCNECTAQGDNLAIKQDTPDGALTYFVHANSRIRVLVDGADATKFFELRRWYRVGWEAPLRDLEARDGDYSKASDWGDDSVKGKGWADTPGFGISGTKGKRPSFVRQRSLQEFMSAVKGLPEFGAIYYIVVYDTAGDQYRVRMFAPKAITIDDWCKIKGRSSGKPFHSEKDSGDPIYDSKWRTATSP
jgi:hypothetical protein